ncbi:MAG: diguanylate phosphodiesterase [Pseudomonadales bacterium]|nr:diguanylate phosphodiesterase [Pseudomonadales bacterium]
MRPQPDFRELGCNECQGAGVLGFDFSMAFQPIVNVATNTVFAYEALCRGPAGESAGSVFAHVNEGNRYRFDQTCRVKAIELAARLGVDCYVSINFMPNAVYKPEVCLRTTLQAAAQWNFPVDRIIFEFTETEQVQDMDHLVSIIDCYKERGFKTAIDDFGSGFAGLSLLAGVRTDFVKIDMDLVRDADQDLARQVILRHTVAMCRDLGIQVVAEGVESRAEIETLRGMGVELFQGFYLARPGFEVLPEVG